MIVVYYKQEKEPLGYFRSFREALLSVVGDVTLDSVGSNGYVFYQGDKCVGVV